MYFWKIEKLKDDIRSDNLSERDRFIYFFICIALSAIGMGAMMYMPIEERNIWDVIDSIGNIIIPIVGTFFAYRENGGANGEDFLGSYFSISFVVLNRFVVLLIPMFIGLFAYYMYAFPADHDIVSTPANIIPFQVWLALLYVRICKHIGDVGNL